MQYDQLPVFKAASELVIEVYHSCRTMKREYRYTIGERLKELLGELQLCIYRAQTHKEKVTHVMQAREHVEAIRLKVRLLRDLHQMPIKNMARIVLHLGNISSQLVAWEKALRKLEKQEAKEEILMT